MDVSRVIGRVVIPGLLTVSANVAFAAGPAFEQMELHKARGGPARYKGKKAIHLVPDPVRDNDDALAIVKGLMFRNGVIEVDVSGDLAPGHSDSARGFIGIAFRVQPDARHYELLSLRPTNARADDQLRRNHTAAYEGHPDFNFDRLRKESEGVYESYVDVVPGVWTHLKVEVLDTKAKLYVNRTSQPCLIVKDLKLGVGEGAIALWSGPGTDGYFANLRVTPAK